MKSTIFVLLPLLAVRLFAQNVADKTPDTAATPSAPEAPAPAPAPGEATSPALTPEEQAIADTANAYAAAYNKGDVKALAEFFTEDAEWVDADGNVTTGRSAIVAMLGDAIKDGKDRHMDLAVSSVRRISADVLLEKGIVSLTDGDGKTGVSSYTAVHISKDGKWPLTQFTETGAPFESGSALHLAELEWMVGSWTDDSADADVRTTVSWTDNRTFLTRSYKVVDSDGTESSSTEVIGWDPAKEKIRSWTFRSDGGFSESDWTHDGPRWLIQTRSVLPDGGLGASQDTLTMVNKDKATWSSSSRSLDGELLPNIDPVTIIRSK